MKIERLVFACILVVAGSFVAMHAMADKQIFKTTDADGNVVFTDVPPRAQESAEKIDLLAPNSFGTEQPGIATASDRPRRSERGDDEQPVVAPVYQSLTIMTPGDQANVRENAGNVDVQAAIEPGLHPGHSLRLLLDEVPAGSAGEGPVFSLTNVDRGTHTLKAEIVDSSGAVIFTSDPSTFHLQRYSKLTAPNRPKPTPKPKPKPPAN
ncbi:MAG: DUF4124 domain-containing protein [Gammaproteobacteria bacterium]|nr:DUF4124 domain-containing protein [Gammaproteobacteria bacterium]